MRAPRLAPIPRREEVPQPRLTLVPPAAMAQQIGDRDGARLPYPQAPRALAAAQRAVLEHLAQQVIERYRPVGFSLRHACHHAPCLSTRSWRMRQYRTHCVRYADRRCSYTGTTSAI